MKRVRKKAAFSLVELSIVLVILGMLVGGVLAGQSLIRASELRSITSDIHKMQSARIAFRDKYFSLPGDMPNAISFWGRQAGNAGDGVDSTCAALTYATPSTDSRTCNGNGDGFIGTSGSGMEFESIRYW